MATRSPYQDTGLALPPLGGSRSAKFASQNTSCPPLRRVAAAPNVPYPGTGLKGRTDGLTDGLASKHMPSYQQKHRIKILKHLSATFTC